MTIVQWGYIRSKFGFLTSLGSPDSKGLNLLEATFASLFFSIFIHYFITSPNLYENHFFILISLAVTKSMWNDFLQCLYDIFYYFVLHCLTTDGRPNIKNTFSEMYTPIPVKVSSVVSGVFTSSWSSCWAVKRKEEIMKGEEQQSSKNGPYFQWGKEISSSLECLHWNIKSPAPTMLY